MIKHYREVTESARLCCARLENLPVTKDEYEQIAAAIPSEIEENYKSFRESYKKPMPFYIGVPQIDNGKMRINWDASYDFKALDIRVYRGAWRDYAISDVLFKAEDVLLPEVTCDAPDAGQYFVRVRHQLRWLYARCVRLLRDRRRQALRHEVFLRARRR